MSDKAPIERFYDSLAGTYAQRKAASVSARLCRRIILDVVRGLPLGPGPWRVLDAGGGGGLFAAELAGDGHRVCIVDLSAGMLAEALQYVTKAGVRDRVELVKADVSQIGLLADWPFDLVLAVGDVLSYCQQPTRALREFHRLTRPGGMLLADVECRYGGVHGWRRGRTLDEVYRTFMAGQSSPPGRPDVDIRLYGPSEFREHLQLTGWRVSAQWPGAVLWALLGSAALQEFGGTPDGFDRLLEMERSLRKVPELLAAGGDLQFLATR